MPSGVDTLTLSGTADISATGNGDATNIITGNSGNDTLSAGSGNDVLVSGSGVDTLVGGSGPDTFIINNSADLLQLAPDFGWQDSVESSVSYVLTAPAAALTLVGADDLSGTDDYGYATITGNAGNDTLVAGSGSDTLIAGTGVDTFEAGTGNNTFVINNADDVIQLGSAPGDDSVESSVSHTLEQGLDTLQLIGNGDLEAQGNDDAANWLQGNSGNDTLIAGSGNDTLVGGSGNDTLVAGSGTDVFEGGAGNATYVFNSGFGQAEIQPGAGSGTIEFGAGVTPSDLSIGLTTDSRGDAGLLIQDGNSHITVGGGLSGRIGEFAFASGAPLTLSELLTGATVSPGSVAGSSGNAVLDTSSAASLSGSGDDTILGTGISDTLVAGIGDEYLLAAGDNASVSGGFGDDTLVGGGANDTVVAGNGNQQLYGTGSGDVVTGGMGDDTLYGGVGPDTLIAGAGNTIIYGGAVRDSIVLGAGATTAFYARSTSSSELIELPIGLRLGDFVSYEGGDGDLILQSASGGTTAVIKGFYTASGSGKLWMIADSTGAAQLLSQWLDAQQPSPPSGYKQEIDELRQAFAAGLEGTLNQIGQQGGTIRQPGRTAPSEPGYQYQFEGVKSQNISVEGGFVNLGSSDEDQATYTTLQTGSTTYAVTTPVYGEVTIPGWEQFIPDSSLTQLEIENMDNELGDNDGSGLFVNAATDSSGNPGFTFGDAPSIEYEQTGTKTTIETVPEYTTSTQETQTLTTYNVTGDGGNDVISVGPVIYNSSGQDVGPYFAGTVDTGNGNVSVDLGMNNWYEPLGDSGTWNGTLSPGGFIQAGDGNDTIVGTGGADVIAAGMGFDNITAAFGSKVYVPMQGASTESINIIGPFYGNGLAPFSTLVLPTGVTGQDLTFRAFDGPTGLYDQYGDQMEILQISDGDSSVLVDFTAVDSGTNGIGTGYYLAGYDAGDINGIDRIQFSDGTTLSRSQLVGAPISIDSLRPFVTAGVTSGDAASAIQGASLFHGHDNTGIEPITWYQVSNAGTGGAYFVLNGVVQAPGKTLYVSKDELANLSYVSGTGGTSDTISVSAFDGVVWGATTSFGFNASAASVYQATTANERVTGASIGPDTLVGGYGGDTLVGASGQDTFEYGAGGGAEFISETQAASGTSDNILKFGSGITPASLTLSSRGDPELVLSIGTGGDSVAIEGFDPLNPLQAFPIQSFDFSDGTTLSLLQLLADNAVTGTTGSITNADGSVTSYDFTPSGQQVYSAREVNSSGRLSASVSLNGDGSMENWAYTYNPDGSWSSTDVTTPAGGGGSTTAIDSYDAAGDEVSWQVKYPDGSTEEVTLNSQGQRLTDDITRADGSTDDTAYTYNSGGTWSTTEVTTPAGGGGATTAIDSYDAAGNEVSWQVKYPDGSTEEVTFNSQGQRQTDDITHADGSTDDTTYTYNSGGSSSTTDVTTPAGGGGATTAIDSYDAAGNEVSWQVKYPDGTTEEVTLNSQGQRLTDDITRADGSTDDTAYTYNSGGTWSTTEVTTPAGGGGATTAIDSYDAAGNEVSWQVTNPDGSTEDVTFNSQGKRLADDHTYADGSTDDMTYTYNSDGTWSTTDVSIPSGGGATTTSVSSYDVQGNQLTENAYTPDANGSYTDTWSKADGSHGSYWWNASTSEYQEDWHNSDGSSWTDDYQYANGGSPGVTGYSFTETYTASDGSHGARQFDASTGTVSLTWDSAATGSLSGTTTDSGFIGLQHDGELTNTQQDPTFFNPNVSASFNAFLATH